LAFHSTINYSSCNEDWRTEWQALRFGSSDRALVVTGSGDRPLHALLQKPAAVVAIDRNPCQNHLLALKAAALRELDYGRYVDFLGLETGEEPAKDGHGPKGARELRRTLFARLQAGLEPETARFFAERQALVDAGVLYQGRFERYYGRVARLGHLLRGRAIGRLFAFADLEEQRAFVRESWDRRWWRLTYDALCSPVWSRLFLRDPAFYPRVRRGLAIGQYLYEGMLATLDRHLARENFMLSLVLRGRLSQSDLPPYLTPEGHAALAPLLGRLSLHTGDLLDFLEGAAPGSFTRFSLSDVPSYLDATSFERLMHGIVRAAAPGARFCVRLFLSTHEVPPSVAPLIEREPELEALLAREDRAFAYRFIVGSVRARQ
jgi:S-adenosylmethionine-diacylglycerol 3-amino-3-carboxypropyl transferase